MEAPGLANQRAVRRHNLGVVLRHVSERGPRSRATIALETGLNKTTVSSLVTELIGLDLVVERGLEQRGTVGRPGQVVELSGEGVVALGLEINVDYLAVRALDLTRAERHRGLDRVGEGGLEQRGTVGRPGQVVELSGEGVVALGLEINVDYLAVRALDLTGAERHRGLDVEDNRRVSVAKVLDRLAGHAKAAL